jgi:hypothetical protein
MILLAGRDGLSSRLSVAIVVALLKFMEKQSSL